MARDVSDSVSIRGQRRAVVGAVLDADTGLIVHMLHGTSPESVLARVLKAALVSPTAPLIKAVPDRLVVAPDLLATVKIAAAGLSKLSAAAIVEGHRMHEAEEVVDALVGHMEGRNQPEETPTTDDWQVLYREIDAFTDAAPWKRWSDSDWFQAQFQLSGETIERDCLVLGNAGLQHGFNMLPDANSLLLASDSDSTGRLAHLERALMVHLDPWRETHGVYADKARRYGWPNEARLVPSLLTVRDHQPADPSAKDVRLLSLGLHGVHAQDSTRLISAGHDSRATGELAFADGTLGRFEVNRP